jgi:fructose-1-phosphate kinase PfkB-like protein
MALPVHADNLPPILSVTLNPVIDRTLWVQGFRIGRTVIAERSVSYAGGKGINTSRALLNLGVRSTATGIIGEHGSKTYLDTLDTEGIAHDFLFAAGSVRTNVTMLSEGERETHIRDRGPRLTAGTFQRFLHRFRKLIEGMVEGLGASSGPRKADNRLTGPIVVLSGSIPDGIPAESYRMLLLAAREMGATALLDASGTPLKLGLEAEPFFVKPNRYEVQEVLGFLPEGESDYRRAIDSLHALRIGLVMVSRGREGLYLSDGKRLVSASVSVECALNTVGSGDAAVAGAVLGIGGDLSIDETARLACAMGAANTLSPGACIFTQRDVQRLYERVLIEAL